MILNVAKYSRIYEIDKRRLFRHGRAFLFSLVVLCLALTILWLGHALPTAKNKTIDVREISVSSPPPPPPPPRVEQPQVENTISVVVPGAGPEISLAKVQPRIEWEKPDITPIDTQQTSLQTLDINWDAFELDDLDGNPTLLTSLRIKFPKSLSRRGISKVLVKLRILIDERGKVTLIDIKHNPHPELVAEIERLVRNSRFTAPKKNDQPVRVKFIWPIEISS
jgi:outer membrane biosynthesis protein TonB